MTTDRALARFRKALKKDFVFRCKLQEEIADFLVEDQRKQDKADLKYRVSALVLTANILDHIF